MKQLFKGLIWGGVRTEKFDELCNFYEQTLQLPVAYEQPGFKMFTLPNGDWIDVFSTEEQYHQHFTTGPAFGFEVDDIEETKQELEKNGITFIGSIQSDKKTGTSWAHFKGVDGNMYEITSRKKG